MCLALYLASAKLLPLVPWDADKPEFNVVELPESASPVRKLLRYEHVYYVRSHQGCSCAFNYEHESKSVLALRDYLRTALVIANEIEGFTCRTGTETPIVKHRVTTSPAGLALPDFLFRDGQHLVIRSRKTLHSRRPRQPDLHSSTK